MTYRVLILGQLDAKWAAWFGGMAIAPGPRRGGQTTTALTGPVADQAALHGILARIRDLNLTIVSVTWLDSPVADHPPIHLI